MRILILGEAKSGTTMLYRAVCDARGAPPEHQYFEPDDLTEVDLSADEVVVKKLLGNLRSAERDRFIDFDRRVLLVRDPRDRLVSWLLYDIHAHAHRLDEEKLESYLDLLRRKEADPAAVPFVRLTHTYWRLTGVDLLGALARSTKRSNDILGRFSDMFQVVRYERLVEGHTFEMQMYLEVDDLAVPDVGPDLQRVVRTRSHGDWRHWFTERDLLWLRPMVSATLRHHDYPREWELAEDPEIDPEHASRYVERVVADARASIPR